MTTDKSEESPVNGRENQISVDMTADKSEESSVNGRENQRSENMTADKNDESSVKGRENQRYENMTADKSEESSVKGRENQISVDMAADKSEESSIKGRENQISVDMTADKSEESSVNGRENQISLDMTADKREESSVKGRENQRSENMTADKSEESSVNGRENQRSENMTADTTGVKSRWYNRTPATQTKPSGLYYDVWDNPPIHMATLFGFQIAVANVFVVVSIAVIISNLICADQAFTASLLSTTSVMSGICTILQTSLGVRLPIFQGPSILFLIPYMTAASDPAWGCQSSLSTDSNSSLFANVTGVESLDQPWIPEWNKIQGSLMVASVLHILIGGLGLGGLLQRLMGPMAITCLILLLGVSMHSFISELAEIHWGMACLNIVMIIVLSQYVNKYNVPMPTWTRGSGCSIVPFPLFELFPVLIQVIIGWIISYIFTVCGVFPDDPSVLQYEARTDFATDSIREASVFTIPYPGQYGVPTIKFSYFVLLCVAVLGSSLESIGDYVQTTGPCRVAIPPSHAINRGLLVEGIGSMISGVLGAGHATTSYSNMMGIIGITKVASRRVFNIAGVFMIVTGICGKLTAVLAAIPKPVLAGPMFICLAVLVGAALSNLREVDLWSTRSQAVLGIAIMTGTVFPIWLQQHPDTFNTGSHELDETLMAVVGTPLLLGAITAMFLDVTMPGNSRIKKPSPTVEAGVGGGAEESSRKITVGRAVSQDLSIYELPLLGRWLSTWRSARYLPFLPNPSKLTN